MAEDMYFSLEKIMQTSSLHNRIGNVRRHFFRRIRLCENTFAQPQ